MWLILLEAFAALAVLGAIVWWTMFAGRRGGERQVGPDALEQSPQVASAPPSPASADGTPLPAAAPGKITPP